MHELITTPGPDEPVTLRLSTLRDDASLARLAELEDRATPAGRHLVAEVGGTVVAALPLGPGPILGDPFRPTGHLVSLLHLWAKQLRRDRPQRRRRAAWDAIRAWRGRRHH